MLRYLIVLVIALTTSACAYGDAKLALSLNDDAVKAGLLSEAEPATIYLADIDDRRTEKERIGYKRNGYGMKTADILSEEPVPDVVKDALAEALEANGHILGDLEERYALQTTLTNFWFDFKTGFVSVEFFGSVQADLAVVDRATGETLYTEQFDGYYSEKNGGGLSGTWERIMNLALADFISKVNLSPGLMEALATVAANEAETGAAEAEAVGS
jgi:hypothetical protein